MPAMTGEARVATHDHKGETSSRGTLGRLILGALARFADRDMIGDGKTH